jgi:hypothetical protein
MLSLNTLHAAYINNTIIWCLLSYFARLFIVVLVLFAEIGLPVIFISHVSKCLDYGSCSINLLVSSFRSGPNINNDKHAYAAAKG